MLSKLLVSLGIAVRNIRRNLFHTLISVIGVVIGVAALVSILSLIDGMEKSIRDAITGTLSLQTITIESEEHEEVDGVWVRREEVPVLTVEQIQKMRDDVGGITSARMEKSFTARLYLENKTDTLAGQVYGEWNSETESLNKKAVAGRLLTPEEAGSSQNIATVNKALAEKTELNVEALLGETIRIRNQPFEIVGVAQDSTAECIEVRIPVLAMNENHPDFTAPEVQVEAEKFEYVDDVKSEIDAWLTNEFEAGDEAFSVQSTQLFLQEASQGILIFKLFMGAIVGIAVIVGGVGIMNVLLIAVRERTKEIGIRKATGARKKDIALQFLSESVAISMLCSILGLILGFAGTYLIVAIIGAFVDIGSYQAVFTLGTLIVVVAVAIVLGIIFGTYPAMKASRLTPVDAIRHE